MLRFLSKRLGDGLLTLAALVTLTFFVMRLTPGGPFSSNRKISPTSSPTSRRPITWTNR
jgi:oligopeptide transport system permease protein